MRLIGFFQKLDFFRGELDRDRRDRIFQVLGLGCANDRGSNDRLGEHPGQGHLRHRQSAGFSHFADLLGDG